MEGNVKCNGGVKGEVLLEGVPPAVVVRGSAGGA